MTVSAGYEKVDDPGEAKKISAMFRNSWQDASIPERQWAVAGPELAQLKAGAGRPPMTTFLEVLKCAGDLKGGTLLEVGCGCAYYKDVLEAGGVGCEYTGMDYSPAFGKWLAERRPDVKFFSGDATDLPFLGGTFDVVVEGAVMLHVYEYPLVVAEVSRVSSRWAVFHRTPLSLSGKTEFWKKTAYGVPCFEIHFGRDELVRLWAQNGLRIRAERAIPGGYPISSFLLEKAGH